MTHNLRRTARERALQLLFLLEMNPPTDAQAAIQRFWEQQALLQREQDEAAGTTPADDPFRHKKLRAFAQRLTDGVLRHQAEIDIRLAGYLQNWSLARLGGIERNVLRLALYELFYERDVPPVVCINEAVDLAKFFSATGSGRFVNGILDRAKQEVARDPRQNTGWAEPNPLARRRGE